MLFMGAIGMFGAGVGMLYTPILVDRLQLTFPSGLAVANILRALTDPVLLKRSVSRLGTGMGLGLLGGLGSAKLAWLGAIELSTSTLGAGLLVGARIGVAALVAGLTGTLLIPLFVDIGWLQPGEPFRKITFLIGLGLIMGAAILDIGQILVQAWRRWRSPPERREVVPTQPDWQRTHVGAWWPGWCSGGDGGVGGSSGAQPAGVLHGAGHGAGLRVRDGQRHLAGHQRQQSHQLGLRVTVVVLMAAGPEGPHRGPDGRRHPAGACSVAGDMQQDRSTGWRLGTPRTIQFRFQVMGLVVGALLGGRAGPDLHDGLPRAQDQQLRQPEGRRRAVAERDDLQVRRGAARDSILLSSPYAFSFGGFVEWPVTAWFAAGGCVTSLVNVIADRLPKKKQEDIPEDMSTMSLIGGGLVAGESIYALAIGVWGLLKLLR
jgi:hypothetical protein